VSLESVGKALASVEEALISVRQAFGPSASAADDDKNTDGGPQEPILHHPIPPTPPAVRKVEVLTESNLASVNITVPRPSPRVGKKPMPHLPPPKTSTTEEVSFSLKLRGMTTVPAAAFKFVEEEGETSAICSRVQEVAKVEKGDSSAAGNEVNVRTGGGGGGGGGEEEGNEKAKVEKQQPIQAIEEAEEAEEKGGNNESTLPFNAPISKATTCKSAAFTSSSGKWRQFTTLYWGAVILALIPSVFAALLIYLLKGNRWS
jgi:hypothetical protein